MKSQGFTLFEFLIVLAILGVILGLLSTAYLRSIRAAEVREGANQIAADLRSARSSAQRRSTASNFRWAGTGALTTYTVEIPAGTTTPRLATLPPSVRFRCLDGCPTSRTLTYNSPYGEMTSSINGTRFLVESRASNIPSLQVRVVGVTGRVTITGNP